MFALGSTDAFIRWFTNRLHTIPIQKRYQLFYYSNTWKIYILDFIIHSIQNTVYTYGRKFVRSKCDTQPVLLWSCALYAQRHRYFECVYVWFPFFAFVPFFVCTLWTHHQIEIWSQAHFCHHTQSLWACIFSMILYIVYVSIATNHRQIKAIFLNFFIFHNGDPDEHEQTNVLNSIDRS